LTYLSHSVFVNHRINIVVPYNDYLRRLQPGSQKIVENKHFQPENGLKKEWHNGEDLTSQAVK
jgi:hypothetical protein